jgi:hypothetical protein
MRTITPPTATKSAAERHAGADIPRRVLRSEEREAWVIVLYMGGATVGEIADALSAGRDWVRHCVIGAGLACRRGARQIDALAILREVRKSGTLSLKEAAARLGYSEETVRQSISALAMSESVRRLMRLRRRAARRVAVANAGTDIGAAPVRMIGTRRTPAVRVA